MISVAYSINQYDSDGDIFDECLLLHVGNTILRFRDLEEFNEFICKANRCSKQIEEEMK